MTVETTLAERGATHGAFGDNARVSQAVKHILNTNGKNNLPYDMQEALDMICLKISRIVTGKSAVKDHWLDIAGYATLVANTLED